MSLEIPRMSADVQNLILWRFQGALAYSYLSIQSGNAQNWIIWVEVVIWNSGLVVFIHVSFYSKKKLFCGLFVRWITTCTRMYHNSMTNHLILVSKSSSVTLYGIWYTVCAPWV